MIADKDRSGFFGASDTHFIMGNWETKTFKKFWFEKLDLMQNDFTNKAMKTGTHYEHKILDFIKCLERDRQVIVPELLLRVNLDGSSAFEIFEVKTHKNEFKLSKQYRQQVIVQMYATKIRQAYIVSYQLTEADYVNYFNEIDGARIHYHQIDYDEKFIQEYLKRLKYLVGCLKEGRMPDQKEGGS